MLVLKRYNLKLWTWNIFRYSHSINNKMASTELLRRLETRAVTAEQIIVSLKHEVEEIKKMSVRQGNQMKIQQLQNENEELRKEIEDWKNRLIQLEISNGIKQVSLPGKAAAAPPSEGKTKEPSLIITQAPPSNDKEQSKVEKAEKKKKDKPVESKKAKVSGDGPGVIDEPPVDVGRLDLRVGRIVTVKRHPDADSLYVEEVDVGEEKPRTVVSGLVKHVPLEEMQDRMVVLLCNLKPAKMRGITSEAMVMCASSLDKVEILSPPAGAIPGDQIHVEGYTRLPDPVLNPKKKIFETVAPDLKTDTNKVATYKGGAFSVSGKGVVTAPTLIGVNIK